MSSRMEACKVSDLLNRLFSKAINLLYIYIRVYTEGLSVL